VALAIICLCAALLTVFAERMQRADWATTWMWLGQHPDRTALNCALYLAPLLLLVFLFNNLYIGLVLAGLPLLLLGTVNGYKQAFLEQPLFPWDLALARQVVNLAPGLRHAVAVIPAALVFLAGASVFYWHRFLPRFRFRLWLRAALCLLSGAFIWMMVPVRGPVLASFNRHGIVHAAYAAGFSYRNNGFLLSFAMNCGDFTPMAAPVNYGRPAIEAIARPLVKAAGPATAPAPVHPHVIVIMNESFWDPTLLPGARFSADPIPHFHALRAEGGGGAIISPVFGGFTASVEFEILSGWSNYLLPFGCVPYQYVNRPMPSLPKVFAEHGYLPIAVHPYETWYWNRNVAYENLGFARFEGLSTFRPEQTRGNYIGDQAVIDRIIERVEGASQPLFIFAVTMQNHGPYEAQRYPAIDTQITSSIPAGEIAPLITYTQGVHDGDKALGNLISHFRGSDKPVIIAFFGDHLPYLGPGIYHKLGLTRDTPQSILEDLHNTRRVPVAMWANCPTADKLAFGEISPNFLGGHLLRLAGIRHPFFVNFLERLRAVAPALTVQLSLDAAGRPCITAPPAANSLLESYRLLQYDMMFGQQYAQALLFAPPPPSKVLLPASGPVPPAR
jgi:phosphoglycerol transferase MdoB-like AlkP superfamily enzyme